MQITTRRATADRPATFAIASNGQRVCFEQREFGVMLAVLAAEKARRRDKQGQDVPAVRADGKTQQRAFTAPCT